LGVTIHTGSRNLGKKVCEYWQRTARGEGDRKKEIFNAELKILKVQYTGRKLGNKINELRNKLNKNITVKSVGLEFLEGVDIFNYLYDMIFAQEYANLNRHVIASTILDVLDVNSTPDFIQSIHNYVNFDDMIIRKGAISAYKGQKCIIPLNSRDGVLICEGLSNADWNYSAPHGAGRVLSRTKAKELITTEQAKNVMKNIYTFVTPVDESPLVYKNSKIIEDAIKPTVTVIDKIIPIHNLKSIG